MTLVDMVCSIFPTYLYCFIGSFTTDNFSKYGDGFYESNWIDLPVHLKKYIAIAICDAQRPLYFEGLGLFALNLKTFAKVIIDYAELFFKSFGKLLVALLLINSNTMF